MIHEFAVEPEVMATWEHFRVLWEDFGVSRGRFLVEYPKHWRRRVIDLAGSLSKPVRATSIKSKLTNPAMRQVKLVGARGRPYGQGGQEGWLPNALAQQDTQNPFRAIVALEAAPGRNDVLAADEFARDEPPWKVETQCRCKRTAAEITGAVRCLLRHSKELVLVDPNFDPSERRFQEPFKEMVNIPKEMDNNRSNWTRLELHAAFPKTFREEAIEDQFRRHLPALLPKDARLRVYLRPRVPEGDRDRLHDRFVLTERGGICSTYGWDEGNSPEETTLLSLLAHEVFLEYRQDYREDAETFGQPKCIEIAAEH